MVLHEIASIAMNLAFADIDLLDVYRTKILIPDNIDMIMLG